MGNFYIFFKRNKKHYQTPPFFQKMKTVNEKVIKQTLNCYVPNFKTKSKINELRFNFNFGLKKYGHGRERKE